MGKAGSWAYQCSGLGEGRGRTHELHPVKPTPTGMGHIPSAYMPVVRTSVHSCSELHGSLEMPPVTGKPCFQLELYPWRMGFSGLIAVSALICICYYYKQQLLLPLLLFT